MASKISKRQPKRGRQSLPDNPLTSLLENEEKQEFERQYETRRRREMRQTLPSTLSNQLSDFEAEEEIEPSPQRRGKLPRRTKPSSPVETPIEENGPVVKRRIGPSSPGYLDLDVYDLETDVHERPLRISPSLVEARPMSPLRRQRKLLSARSSGQDKPQSEVNLSQSLTGQDNSAQKVLQSNESRSERVSGPSKGNESSRRPVKRLKIRALGKHSAARSNIDTNHGVAMDRVDQKDAVKGAEPVNDVTAELNEDTAHVTDQPKPLPMQSSRVRKRPRGKPRLSVTFENNEKSSHSGNTSRTSNGTQNNRSKKSQDEKRQTDSSRDLPDQEADNAEKILQQHSDAAEEEAAESPPGRNVPKLKKLSKSNNAETAPGAIQPGAPGPNPETATDEQENEENTSGANLDKSLLGQRKVLTQAFAVMAEANFEGTRAAKRPITKEILSLCEKATEKFNTMRINGHSGESRLDVPEEILSLEQQILALQGRSPDKQINRHDHPLIRDTYQHIIPALLKLCNKSVLCYEAIDKDQASGMSMTTNSLQTVARIVSLVADAGESLKRNEKGHITKALSAISDEPVQSKISSGVITPFRMMRHKFIKYIDRQNRRAEQALMEEQQTAAIELHIEHEDLAYERKSRLLPIRRRWDSLHVDRLYIAGLIPDRERRRLDKPKCPKDPKVIFIRGGSSSGGGGGVGDDDSDEPARVEVLTVRIGPPPALIQKASQHIWTNEQLLALHDGLRDFAGEDVLNKIIQKHCGKGRVLNAYNVTEIVTMAALLKEQLERHQFESQGGIDGWVKGIPVWTEARVLGTVEEVGRGFGDDEED